MRVLIAAVAIAGSIAAIAPAARAELVIREYELTSPLTVVQVGTPYILDLSFQPVYIPGIHVPGRYDTKVQSYARIIEPAKTTTVVTPGAASITETTTIQGQTTRVEQLPVLLP